MFALSTQAGPHFSVSGYSESNEFADTLSKLATIVRTLSISVLVVCVPAICFPQSADLDLLRDLDRFGRRMVLAPCAKPSGVKLQGVQNRYEPNVRDEVKLVTCRGMKAETYIARTSEPPRILPLSLKVTGNELPIPAKLQVGARSENLKALGKPVKVKGGSFTYVLPSEPGNDSITFETANARIRSIHWSWDVD